MTEHKDDTDTMRRVAAVFLFIVFLFLVAGWASTVLSNGTPGWFDAIATAIFIALIFVANRLERLLGIKRPGQPNDEQYDRDVL